MFDVRVEDMRFDVDLIEIDHFRDDLSLRNPLTDLGPLRDDVAVERSDHRVLLELVLKLLYECGLFGDARLRLFDPLRSRPLFHQLVTEPFGLIGLLGEHGRRTVFFHLLARADLPFLEEGQCPLQPLPGVLAPRTSRLHFRGRLFDFLFPPAVRQLTQFFFAELQLGLRRDDLQ